MNLNRYGVKKVLKHLPSPNPAEHPEHEARVLTCESMGHGDDFSYLLLCGHAAFSDSIANALDMCETCK